MKIILSVLIYIVIIFSTTQVAAKTLEVVTLQYPPFEYLENGKLKGVVVEIVQEVFRRMQQPINISLLPWARSIKMIENGTADAIFTIYKTPEREVFADYSQEILMPQVVSFFVLKDSPVTFDGDLAKLSNYLIGAVWKISYGEIFDEALDNKKIKTINLAYTGEINIDMLLHKRFDILVSNKYGALYVLKNKGLMDQVKELSPEIENVPSYIAFSKKRNLVSIRDKFDEILVEMKKDGTYNRITNSYFK